MFCYQAKGFKNSTNQSDEGDSNFQIGYYQTIQIDSLQESPHVLKVCLSFIDLITTLAMFKRSKSKKNKENVPVDTQTAILKLRETERMLEKKQEYLEMKIERETATAKKNVKTNKRIALQALKRKKRLEKQLSQIDGTLSTIEFQRDALESSNTNNEVIKNMAFAAKALKQVHQVLDVDDVHDTMDEIHEQSQIAEEISQAITSVGTNDFDDGDLELELEELAQEELEKSLLKIKKPDVSRLPNVPSSRPLGRRNDRIEDDEFAELKELEAWAC